MLNIVVVEDEALVAKRLIRFINESLADEKLKIIHFDYRDEAQDYLNEKAIDLLFLDLNLHGDDGFKLLRTHLCASYHTIVVSANTDRAIEAYDLGVLDFIAKPFTQERVKKAIDRALGSKSDTHTTKVLAIEKAGRIELIKLEDIVYIRAAGHYSDIVTNDGNIHLHQKNLSNLLKLLPQSYHQVHRSYLADIKKVSTIHKKSGGQYELGLIDGACVPLGRSYYHSIRKLLTGE